MELKAKHVVAMVASISAAVVLAPVGVLAASGQLVHVTDPYYPERRARVSTANLLQVESRPGLTGAFSKTVEKSDTVVGSVILETAAPKRIAVTEFSVTVHGNVSNKNEVRIYYRIRTSGTAPCANHTGWSLPVTLRSISTTSTNQLVFNGPPLLLPKPAAGQAVCLGIQQTTWWNGTSADMSVSGFTFE